MYIYVLFYAAVSKLESLWQNRIRLAKEDPAQMWGLNRFRNAIAFIFFVISLKIKRRDFKHT